VDLTFNVFNDFVFLGLTIFDGEFSQQFTIPIIGDVDCNCPIVLLQTDDQCINSIYDLLEGNDLFYDCEGNCYTLVYSQEERESLALQSDYSLIPCQVLTPIVLDLDGDGIELINPEDSKVRFDMDSDGINEIAGWVGADDAMLVYDKNQDGIVNDTSEIAFSEYHKDANTDLEGLKLAFDSNNDDIFNDMDNEWANFGIWQDLNSDGITDLGEFTHLSETNIISINLVSDDNTQTNNGNIIFGTTEYNLLDGTTGKVADVALRYDELLEDNSLEDLVNSSSVSNNEQLGNQNILHNVSDISEIGPAIDTISNSITNESSESNDLLM
jgi:hypothetical protein